jgi:hypothetical protein
MTNQPQSATAQTTAEPNHTKMTSTTTRSVTAQRDLSISILGGLHKDYIIFFFHYGSGQTSQQSHIDALKAVTTTGNLRNDFEFFSLAESQQHVLLF